MHWFLHKRAFALRMSASVHRFKDETRHDGRSYVTSEPALIFLRVCLWTVNFRKCCPRLVACMWNWSIRKLKPWSHASSAMAFPVAWSQHEIVQFACEETTHRHTDSGTHAHTHTHEHHLNRTRVKVMRSILWMVLSDIHANSRLK